MMISAPKTVQPSAASAAPVVGLPYRTIQRFRDDFAAVGATLSAPTSNSLRADFIHGGKLALGAALFNDTLGGMQLLMTAPPSRCGYPEPSLAQLTAAVKLLPGVTYVATPMDSMGSSAPSGLFYVRTSSQSAADRLQQLLRPQIGGRSTFVQFDAPLPD